MVRRVEDRLDNYDGQVPIDVTTFRFSKGLNTESSQLTFPPESAVDISNFELLIDGSVRRRRGLKQRGLSYAPGYVNLASGSWTWTRWKPQSPYTGNDSFIVVHVGNRLTIFRDTIALGTSAIQFGLYLDGFKSFFDLTDVGSKPLSFAQVNGDLVVSGSDIHTFYIRCENESGTEFKAVVIYPLIRDFAGAPDDVPVDYKPKNSTGEYTEDHRYNLRNRGWTDFYTTGSAFRQHGITRFIDDSTGNDTAPAKNMLPWRAFVQTAAGIPRTWRSDTLISETYGTSSAPVGSLKNYMWLEGSIQYAVALNQDEKFLNIERPVNAKKIIDIDTSTWIPGNFVTTTITLDEDPAPTRTFNYHNHGRPYTRPPPLTAGDIINIFGCQFWSYRPSDHITYYWLLDGFYEVQAISGAGPWVVTIETYVPSTWSNGTDGIKSLGTAYIPFRNTVVLNYTPPTAPPTTANEETITNRIVPNVFHKNKASLNAAYAGRLWLADYPTYPTSLFFSRIIVDDKDYDKFHQRNDPTSDLNSDLLPDDGGTIVIPDIVNITALIAFGNYLFVFGRHGVWVISGGDSFFSADNVVVRKIADIGAVSRSGVVVADSVVYFVSDHGFYAISSDPSTGLPNVTSLTATTIQRRWNEISKDRLEQTQLYFDEAFKRLYVIYTEDEGWLSPPAYNIGNKWLIFDIRLGAWYAYDLPHNNGNTPRLDCFYGAVVTESFSATNDYRKLQCILVDSNGGSTCGHIKIADFGTVDYGVGSTPFTDFTTVEAIPYIVTGYDSQLGDFQLKRQAPFVHTFMKKTELGYTDDGMGTLVPQNESGLTMQATWDWTDNTVTGKWGSPQEIYRHPRLYIPENASDKFNDGYPVVVRKNKVRGSGRALSLRFQGVTGKDAHLLGWAIRYKGNKRY